MGVYLFLILFFLSGGLDDFRPHLDKFLEKSLKNYERFEYQIISQPNTEKDQIFIDESRDFKIIGNIGYVPITLLSSNGIKTKSLMSLKLKLFKKVIIAAKDIKRGELLKAGNTVLSNTDVALRQGDFLDTSRLASYQTKLNIQKGDVIMMHMIEKLPLIKKGDQVTACVIKGKVRIDIDAIARQDGCENEVISIITIDKKNFKAKVIDRYSVLITE